MLRKLQVIKLTQNTISRRKKKKTSVQLLYHKIITTVLPYLGYRPGQIAGEVKFSKGVPELDIL